MQYLNNRKSVSGIKSLLALFALFFSIFIFYAYTLLSWALAQRDLERARMLLEKARSLDEALLVEKSLLYQKALRLVKEAARLNPYDAEYCFEYAEVIREAGEDSGLSSSFDIDSLGVDGKDDVRFYNLAKSYYLEAVKKEPTNAIYHQRLGSMYDKLSDTKNAEEEFKKAVLLDPQNMDIHMYLSWYFSSLNKEKEFLYHLSRVEGFYKIGLPLGPLKTKIEEFFKNIGREDLIKI